MNAPDPVTFEVIKHRLWQINDEQGIAIKTISASPIVVEGNDYNVGLFTAEAELVTAGIGSLVHVTTMGDALKSVIEGASDIRDGDAFMTNDPFLGALHQNDVVMASPVFRDGEVFMWAANVLHHADVGGIDAGSFCINARTIFEDPPRFFMKIVDRGKPVREAEHTFVSNSRLPDSVALDLRAQIGALNVARDRLRELLDERGRDLVRAVMKRSIDVAERRVRDLVRELPDGSWNGEAFMDGVRVGDERICRVALTLRCDGDRLHFDYAGSSDRWTRRSTAPTPPLSRVRPCRCTRSCARATSTGTTASSDAFRSPRRKAAWSTPVIRRPSASRRSGFAGSSRWRRLRRSPACSRTRSASGIAPARPGIPPAIATISSPRCRTAGGRERCCRITADPARPGAPSPTAFTMPAR